MARCSAIFGSARMAIPLLSIPGLQDITAWVDFTLLAEACASAGFELAGLHHVRPTSSPASGSTRRCTRHRRQRCGQFARLANQARQLMLPGEMGERFKAMAWLRGMDLARCPASRCRICASRFERRRALLAKDWPPGWPLAG
jgi:SAM-dependent MidA family methyltransferase